VFAEARRAKSEHRPPKLEERRREILIETFFNMWFVYILRCADGKLYTGFTKDIHERLNRHHSGSVPSTKSRLPVQLITYLVFTDKYKALAFEKYLKSGSGRAFAKKRLI
jgi:putative endonuclease